MTWGGRQDLPSAGRSPFLLGLGPPSHRRARPGDRAADVRPAFEQMRSATGTYGQRVGTEAPEKTL